MFLYLIRLCGVLINGVPVIRGCKSGFQAKMATSHCMPSQQVSATNKFLMKINKALNFINLMELTHNY